MYTFSARKAVMYATYLLLLSSCATSPKVAQVTPSSDIKKPTIVDAHGAPLADATIKNLLHKGHDIGQAAMLTELVRVIESITKDPLVAGNDARVLVDGPETFGAMFEAIEAAQHHIHVETFILDDDEVGRELCDRLIARRKAGVEVRIIYDAFGSRNVTDELVKKLTDAGVQLYKYHPVNPAEDARIWRSNNRDHRKILIVDGRVAFTGGINISEVYAESSLSISKSKKHEGDVTDRGWRDTHVRLAGPVVHQFQKLFVNVWKEHEPEVNLDSKKYYPDIDPQGDVLARVVASRGGDDEEYELYTVLLAAVSHAREKIWITQAYFAPNESFLEAVRDAARRGVDVRLLLPGVSDAPLVLQASRADYAELLEAGVRIYEHTGTTLHAKTAVIDGVWSTIGSANLDYRSFLHNNEANAEIVGHEFAQTMEKLFLNDLKQAEEVSIRSWRKRPLMQRVKEITGSALRYWF